MTRAPVKTTRLAALLVLAATLSACGAAAPLRIGISTFPTYEFLYLAEAQGFFDAEGVDVRVIEFSSISDTRRAFERGQIDLMAATLVETLAVRDHSSRSPQVVRVLDYSDGADVVLAQPWVTSAAALRGRRVGVELATVSHYVLARGLEGAGLHATDVVLRSLDQAAMEAAFRKGDLDAIVTYPPTSERLRRDLQVRNLFTSAAIPHEIFDVVVADASVIRARRRDIRAVVRGLDRAMRFSAEHPDVAAPRMAAREGVSAAEFAASLTAGITLVPAADQARIFRPGGPLEIAIARADEVLRRAGQLRGRERHADVVTRAFIEGAP